jgi:very-short-patch-repair endonuclease
VRDRIEAVARLQHGTITRSQANEVVGSAQAKALLRSGLLVVMHRGVYRLAAAPVTPWTLGAAAILAARAPSDTLPLASRQAGQCHTPCVSHGLAAALWTFLPAAPDSLVDVSGPRLCRRPGISAHRVALAADEVTVVRGVPVTSAARTVLDLAGSAPLRGAEQVLAAALRRNRSVAGQLRTLMTRRAFHPGSAVLRSLLPDASGPSEPLFLRSEAEEEFLSRVRRAKLPRPEANFVLLGFEVDFVWRNICLVAEIDGRAFHSTAAAIARDHDRDRALTAAGYQVLRFTWKQVKHEGDAVIAAVAAAVAERRLLFRQTPAAPRLHGSTGGGVS